MSVVLDAHEFSQSESTLEIDGSMVRVRLSLNLLELKGVDANGDGRVLYDELDRAIEGVFASIKTHYSLLAPEPAVRVVAEKLQIVDEHVLQIDVRHTFARNVRRLEVTSSLDDIFGPAHQHLAAALVNGGRRRAVLDASNRTMTIEAARVTFDTVLMVAVAALGLLLLVAYRLGQRRRI